MKPELWLITPLSALVAGGAAMLLQPTQRLAPLIGSGLGALAAAPFIERKARHPQALAQQTNLTDLEQQLRADISNGIHQINHVLESRLQQMRHELNHDIEKHLSTLNPADTLASLATLQEILENHAKELTAIQDALPKSPLLQQGVPRTAVLYDIENLVFSQGQRLAPTKVSELVSISTILDTIKHSVDLGEVQVQRAYGNWMNQVLQNLSPQLDQLKIDRVAVYGRNRDQRNAADIQLAVDAIDIIHQHPEINTFVLVSGDGGFGSIALKLRDYGKTVIGCAYRGSASDSLQRVCHSFILLDNPFDTASRPLENSNCIDNQVNNLEISPSIPISEIHYPPDASFAEIKKLELAKILEFIDYYASNADKKNQLQKGIDFVLFFNDLKKVIPQFDPLRFGFSKPSEAIAYITEQHNSPICLAVNNTLRKAILCWRDQLPSDSTVRSYEPKAIHTVSTYREIFANEVAGEPLLLQVGQWLMVHRPHHMPTNKTKNLIVEHFRKKQLPISKQGVRRALSNYIKVNVISRNQNSNPETISLNSWIESFEDLVQQTQKSFRQVVEKRLAALGETIDEKVFAQAVPLRSQNGSSRSER